MEFIKATADFACYMLNPRAIKWWWRLGSFECMCYSIDYLHLEIAAHREMLQRRLQYVHI